MNSPLAVGLPEAAGMLGITARTLRKMASEGRVPSCKLGSRLVFRIVDLEQLLEKSLRHGDGATRLRVVK